MHSPKPYLNFVDRCCNGSHELPLTKACRLTGLNPQTIKNDRSSATRHEPLLKPVRRGGRLFVSSIEIFNYLRKNPSFSSFLEEEGKNEQIAPLPSRRRGAPTLEEKRAAAARSLTISQLRKEARP